MLFGPAPQGNDKSPQYRAAPESIDQLQRRTPADGSAGKREVDIRGHEQQRKDEQHNQPAQSPYGLHSARTEPRPIHSCQWGFAPRLLNGLDRRRGNALLDKAQRLIQALETALRIALDMTNRAAPFPRTFTPDANDK